MKKLLVFTLVVLSTTILLSFAAYAQFVANNSASGKAGNGGSASISAADADKMALASLKSVNEKMFKHFSSNYRGATNIVVRNIKEDTRVDYKTDGISCGTQYNKKGRWLFTIKHYDESKLSDDTRKMVESGYPGFLVFGSVVELYVQDKKATLVMIENKKEWKRIRVNEDGLSVYEEYRKQ